MLASLARLALQQSARLGEGPALNAPVPLCDEDLDKILELLSEWLLRFIKGGADDDSTAPAIGLLVGLLRTGRRSVATQDAASALYTLASRGSHGDAIREAGGIPLLVEVLRDDDDDDDDEDGAAAAERASGTLAHLAMQRSANRAALVAAGGVPVLAQRLHRRGQAAEYAASALSILALCGTAPAQQAVHEAVDLLPASVLARFPHLRQHVTAASSGASRPADGRHAGARLLDWLEARLTRARARWRRQLHQRDANAPDEFLCPITHEVMSDPVVASDGMGYERLAIRHVLDVGSRLSPLTREVLAPEVYPNHELRRRIVAWQQSGPQPPAARTGLAMATVRTAAVAVLSGAALWHLLGCEHVR